MSKSMYEQGRMDADIDRDVAELRGLLKDVPEPSEPHPAYWNNFLLRVHERVEAETAPKRRAWWSPALIWSSIAGTAALVLVAVVTGLVPFGADGPIESPALADGSLAADAVERPVETSSDIDLVPIDAEMESLIADIDELHNVADEHVVLTASDIEMLDAIESGDDEALLEAMISDERAGI